MVLHSTDAALAVGFLCFNSWLSERSLSVFVSQEWCSCLQWWFRWTDNPTCKQMKCPCSLSKASVPFHKVKTTDRSSWGCQLWSLNLQPSTLHSYSPFPLCSMLWCVCVGVCARTCTQIAIYSSFQINDVQDSTAIPPAQKYAQTIIDPSQSVDESSRIHHECCTLSEVLKTKLATLVKGVVGVISSSSSHWHSRNTWAFGACLDLLVVQSLCMDFIVGKRILNILSPPQKKSDPICMLILQW